MRKVSVRSGQTMLEYVIALFFLCMVAGIVWHFIRASSTSAVRAEELVSSDYP